MERICYCPSEEHMEEAEKLAAPWGVHIQVGESDLTQSFEFDRDKPQILNLPTKQHFAISSGVLKPFETLVCNYVDEYSIVTNVRLAYDGTDGTTEITPILSGDPHFQSWRVRFTGVGEYKVRIFDDDGDIAFEHIYLRMW